MISSVSSPITMLFLPSIRISLRGWRTLSFCSSRIFLPILISSRTKSIFSSSKSSNLLSSYFGKSAKWTDFSPVKLVYISSERYGTIGAIILDKPTKTS